MITFLSNNLKFCKKSAIGYENFDKTTWGVTLMGPLYSY